MLLMGRADFLRKKKGRVCEGREKGCFLKGGERECLQVGRKGVF